MGPLAGMKIVEMAGIGPAPFCASLFADLGATVLRLDRPQPSGLGTPRPLPYNLALRSRPAIKVDLKKPEGAALALTLIERADALIEGFRPGVMERLNLGPDICLERNPKLVYGRMTGWGQTGPLAQAAGHDLNYIALTGALHATGIKDGPPVFPMNLLGDFGGGALYLAFGILAAVTEARQSGRGQVVDCAMVDGVASLMTNIYGMFEGGLMTHERGANSNDSGAHFYNVYQTRDGEWISIAAIEPKFYAGLLDRLRIDAAGLPAQRDKESWPRMKALFAEKFAEKTRAEWCAVMDGSDCCFAPVLTATEAFDHPHLRARDTFAEIAGVRQPQAAPRFSKSGLKTPSPPRASESVAIDGPLTDWMNTDEIETILAAGGVE